MPDNVSERDALKTRQLPEMVLGDASPGSMTAPTIPLPAEMNSAAKAMARFSVKGNAIITGGAGTLALEAARALLEHGVSGLALLDINTAHSAAAIEKLRADFPSSTIQDFTCNITDASSVSIAFDNVVSELGSINILCNFVGVVGCTHAIDMSPEEWRKTLDINTTGAFLAAQAAAKHMISQKTGGSIVFIASISGHRVNFPQPQVAYNVSKSALLHLAHSLSAEWAAHGIRVNTVSPGYMDTILNEGEGLEKARNVWCERNPMGRMGQPHELTGPLILLCSQFGGSYINGTDLVVDGGGIVF
ncbi:NAD(P)-binding protein [Aulographum hederae CBS 113979]|uniref:D-arabinitol 2-dehydrogenase [ribulose-forming] n=1 Tax=Aulographum hederae CBS 113979 TaxID=1176131 RepID=A0A6G1GWU0_9PEZI|nr:NAD(P)-binding protein [Aulographum hederae CBS 113979]